MFTEPTIQKPRTIVLCLDGTSNQFGAENTNVVKLYSILDKTCPIEQTAYYQPGEGTYIAPGIVSPVFEWIAKKADEGIAWYLNDHVMGGYKFLMQSYRAGDKICIFGFSRGAYAARALAGFLYKIGLLLPDNDEQVTFAYELYKHASDPARGRTREDKDDLAAKFKETFCTPVTIDFLGVWDTVASVGVVFGRDLPFTSDNRAVKVFRHAMSLDEHRARFQPNPFHRETPEDAERRRADPSLPVHSESVPDFPRVQEVWFAGCHADVGGSSVADDVRPCLANIPLQWMVKQIILSGCPIKFDTEAMRKVFIDQSIIRLIPSTPSAIDGSPEAVNGISPSTSQTPYWEADVSGRVYDQMWIKPLWLLLEILPIKLIWQNMKGQWKSKWRMNLGRSRKVMQSNPLFHASVKKRIEELGKVPRAKWVHGSEQYID